MSYDRFIAINFLKFKRSKKSTKRVSIILWCIVLITNIPQLFLHSQHDYTTQFNNQNRSVCILNYGAEVMRFDISESTRDGYILNIQIYYLLFFLFAYLLPLCSIFFIYGAIVRAILRVNGQQLNKNKSRITFMVICVIASFVVCWTPLHIMLFLQHVVKVPFTEMHATLLILSNCIAYSNVCVNPIIYAFANRNFRR